MDISNLSAKEIRDLQAALTPRLNRYIPITPTPKQTAALLMNGVRDMLYGGAAGGGKALDVNTPILTANRGWQTIASLCIGDKVFGRDGKPATVFAKSPIYYDHKCYELIFDNDEVIIADAEHRWIIDEYQNRVSRRIMTTEEIFYTMGNRTNHAIYKTAPLNMEEKELERQKLDSFRTVQNKHYVKQVNRVCSVPVQCISVDNAERCYLAGNSLIPTHNSVFLLTAALQYVDTPGYSAILFRKTFSDLMLPGALIPMSQDWLSPFMKSGEVRWQDKEKRYTFLESGATLSFGYLDAKNDELRYQGAEFQFVGMDEVTHIAPEAYRYLFSRLRRLKGSNIPIRMRSTANPGGPHGEYYYQRYFVDKKGIFLPAGLNDNPHLDVDTYRESLSELDEITRQQLENGDWEIRPTGDLFDKQWILDINYKDIPSHVRWVRFWDLAAIDPKYKKKNTNRQAPDWTIGFKLGFADGVYYIGDIIRVQKSPGEIEKIIAETAAADGYGCAIRMEEEGGASGIANTERYAKHILPGYNFAGVKPVVSKIERARPVAAACQVGSVLISTRCRHIPDFFAQLDAFPNGANDDMVDAFSGAFGFFRPNSTKYSPPRPRAEIRIVKEHAVEEAYRQSIQGSYWHSAMSNR